MKNFSFLILLLFLSFKLSAQVTNTSYDSTLAKKLGADEYGMKKYVLVILKTGSNKSEDKNLRDSLFAGHMSNMGRLVKENKLVVAGPIGKNEKTYRGIFILNVTTFEEASELLKTDPAISGNMLEPELYSWYGSAALPLYLEHTEKISKTTH